MKSLFFQYRIAANVDPVIVSGGDMARDALGLVILGNRRGWVISLEKRPTPAVPDQILAEAARIEQ